MHRFRQLGLSAILALILALSLSGCRTSRTKEKTPAPPPSRPKSSSIGPSWEQNVRIRSALDQGDAPRAERLARAVVERQPANAEAHYLLGKSLMAQNKVEGARGFLEKATVLQPDNTLFRRAFAENLDQSAETALQAQDPKQAVAFWKRCLTFKFKPSQTEKKLLGAYRQLGESLESKQNEAEAENAYREAVALLPGTPAPRLDLANLLLKSDRLLEAERVLKELVETTPSYEPGQIAYARLLYRMGDIRGATDKAEKILRMAPESEEAQALKAELEKEVPAPGSPAGAPPVTELDADPEIVQKLTILESTSNFKGQADLLQEYLIGHPNAAWAQLRLGMVLERAGDIPGALAAVNQYLQGQPEDPRAQFFKARCLQMSGDLEGALAILQILEQEKKANIQVFDEIGQVYAKMGRFDDAKASWNKALEIDPEYASVLCSFGQLAMESKNLIEARAYFERAIQKEPFNLKFRFFAGLNLKQAGLEKEARNVWESAKVYLNPSDPYGARILRALGEQVPEAPVISNLTAPPPSLDSSLPTVPGSPAVLPPAGTDVSQRPLTPGDEPYLLALEAARGGRFDEAITGFQAVLRQEPGNFNALINLGKVYSAREDHAQASLQYLKAMEAAPDNQHAMRALIKSYTDQGLHRQAAELTLQAIRKVPSLASEFPEVKANAPLPRSNPRAYAPFVRLLLQDHKPEEALKIIQAGVADNPDDPRLVVLHGEVLYCVNQLDQAEATLQRAIGMDNANPQPFVKLGDLYAARRQMDAAFNQYQLAQKAKFLDPDTAFEIVDRLTAIGKKTDANLLLSRLKGMNLSEAQLVKLRDRTTTP